MNTHVWNLERWYLFAGRIRDTDVEIRLVATAGKEMVRGTERS